MFSQRNEPDDCGDCRIDAVDDRDGSRLQPPEAFGFERKRNDQANDCDRHPYSDCLHVDGVAALDCERKGDDCGDQDRQGEAFKTLCVASHAWPA